MMISPSFKCNFKCPFCDVHKEDQGKILSLDRVKEVLDEVPYLTQIQILGGEPSMLPPDYLEELIKISTEKMNGIKPIMYTNLYNISEHIDKTFPIISFDPFDREHQKRVLSNIISLDMDYDLSIVMTKNLVNQGAKKLIDIVYNLKRCRRANMSVFCKQKNCEDFTPDPETFLQFLKDIVTLDTRHKIFSPVIEFLAGRYKNKTFIDNSTELICTGQFRCYYNSYEEYKMFDTYKEVCKFYENRQLEECCKKCEYLDYCPRGYIENGICHWDTKIMEELKPHVRKYSKQNVLSK